MMVRITHRQAERQRSNDTAHHNSRCFLVACVALQETMLDDNTYSSSPGYRGFLTRATTVAQLF
ncbi:hypothetical protein E2C01_102013 [Portunus trituberculatus]|uniref:Uncharacterized protein n=1 Tax=Portunus trituberculatus TaxID=210409 RepID=A0A5B7KHC2_PORTR|nr:hypothetical protein [Portunus trituberculatus]